MIDEFTKVGAIKVVASTINDTSQYVGIIRVARRHRNSIGPLSRPATATMMKPEMTKNKSTPAIPYGVNAGKTVPAVCLRLDERQMREYDKVCRNASRRLNGP